MRKLAAFGMIALLTALVAPQSFAASAPSYVSSEPEDGAELHQAPDEVSITFSEPLDPSSTMVVKDTCGRALDDGNVDVFANEMSVGIAKKPSGHYLVTYAAVGVGGVTGTGQGRFHFIVHAGQPCTGKAGKHHHNGTDKQNGHANHDGREHEQHNGREHGAGHGGNGADHGEHVAGSAQGGGAHDDHMSVQGAQRFQRQRQQQRQQALASGEAPFPGWAPDSEGILIALVLSALLGVLGGWILRVSPLS